MYILHYRTIKSKAQRPQCKYMFEMRLQVLSTADILSILDPGYGWL